MVIVLFILIIGQTFLLHCDTVGLGCCRSASKIPELAGYKKEEWLSNDVAYWSPQGLGRGERRGKEGIIIIIRRGEDST